MSNPTTPSEARVKKELVITPRNFNIFKYTSTGIPIFLIGVITVATTHLFFLWMWGIFMIFLGLFLSLQALPK
jgi:hypothetical protein